VRLAIVDDHKMVLEGLNAWISGAAAAVQVVATVPAWPDLLEHPQFPVDVVLLDLDLRDSLPAAVKIVTLRSARIATVMMSTHADPAEVRACIAAGAYAYVPKSEPAQEIVTAVTRAAVGQSYMTPGLAALLVTDRAQLSGDRSGAVPALSPQETRALVLYASGLPMKSVARRLGVSFETARVYIDRVREKYAQTGREARTKIELHRRAVEDGLLSHRTE
jgi:DNA-binding NarL/FixJ family response regulator